MERKRVSASNIRAVGYDAGKQLLEIEFSSGSIVQYSGVSPEVHRRFMSSPSPGSFYQDQIDENFPSKRVRQWKAPGGNGCPVACVDSFASIIPKEVPARAFHQLHTFPKEGISENNSIRIDTRTTRSRA